MPPVSSRSASQSGREGREAPGVPGVDRGRRRARSTTHVTVAAAAYDPWRDVMARKASRPGAWRRPRCKIWIEKERRQRRPDILHPAREGGGELHLADGREVGGRGEQGYDEVLLTDESRATWPRAPPPTSSSSTAEGVRCARPPRPLGSPRNHAALDPRDRQGTTVSKVRGRRCPSRPAPSAEASEAFLTGTSAGCLADREIGRPQAARSGRLAPGPVSQAARQALPRDHQRPGLRRSTTGSPTSTATSACASSRASSPRASATSATTSAPSASTSQHQDRRRGDLLHRRLPLHDERARRRRAPRLVHDRRARLPGAAASIRRAPILYRQSDLPETASSPGSSRRSRRWACSSAPTPTRTRSPRG